MRALLLLLLPSLAFAADPAPVAAPAGLVVSSQRLASEIGAEILRRGGNAYDAAVATGYALAVVYPAAGNLGGGGFMTSRDAAGTTHFLDFREKAPAAATATMFQDAQGNLIEGKSEDSWAAAGIPGSPAGLEYIRTHYGTLDRATLMAPAINLARKGYVLTQGDAGLFAVAAPLLARDPQAARIFLSGGKPPPPGARLVQSDLANSLESIAKSGPEAAFYRGPIGAAIAAASHANGGLFTPADFAAYKTRTLPPVTCAYRGFTITSAPPPSSGGTTLCEILQIVQGYDLHAMGFHSAAEIHVLAEAMRHAFIDRNNRLGDPDFWKNPVADLISPAHATAIRAQIDPSRATATASIPVPSHESANTTHFEVADKAGNAVAITYTLNGWFGSGHIAPGTGILLNNEMDDFTSKLGAANMSGLVQGEANAIAPGKTPLSSMTPTVVTKDGKLVMVLGSPGSSRIITIVLEAIINVIDHGMTIQEAIDAPRIHEQGLPDLLAIERGGLSPDTRALLIDRGYKLQEGGVWGCAEGILAGRPALSEHDFGRWGYLANAPGAYYGAHDVRCGAGAVAVE